MSTADEYTHALERVCSSDRFPRSDAAQSGSMAGSSHLEPSTQQEMEFCMVDSPSQVDDEDVDEEVANEHVPTTSESPSVSDNRTFPSSSYIHLDEARLHTSHTWQRSRWCVTIRVAVVDRSVRSL